jgi:hypothetical protein
MFYQQESHNSLEISIYDVFFCSLQELESSSHVCLLRMINNFDCYFFENEIFLLLGDFMV